MIVINGRFLTQNLTGVQRFALEITRRLVNLRDDVVIVVPIGSELRQSVEGARIEAYGKRQGHLWEQLELPRYLRKQGRPLLVNLASTAPAFVRKQISTHHDITYIRHPESFHWSFNVLYRALTPFFLRSSLAVVTVSQFSKREIASHYRVPLNKIHVVENGVDGFFNDPGDTHRDNFFLAVSSPNAHKNFQRLLEAFSEYASETDATLRIVGKQDASFAKQEYGDSRNRVEFLGRVSDEELLSLYQKAKLFIFPSLYEGFGIPPVEAQKCGAPVVASSSAVMPEVLSDSVEYFDPASVPDLVRALRAVDQSPARQRELSALGLVNAARFSWDTSAERVNRLADRLTASTPIPDSAH